MKNSLDRRLTDKGLKITAFRRELLAVLATADAPLSAAQIFATLSKNRRLKPFDRATLFRNLKTLVAKRLLLTTEFGTGAAYYCLGADHHHHHVFCVECKTAQPLGACVAAPMVDQAQRLGFKVLNHRMEILGLCPECR